MWWGSASECAGIAGSEGEVPALAAQVVTLLTQNRRDGPHEQQAIRNRGKFGEYLRNSKEFNDLVEKKMKIKFVIFLINILLLSCSQVKEDFKADLTRTFGQNRAKFDSIVVVTSEVYRDSTICFPEFQNNCTNSYSIFSGKKEKKGLVFNPEIWGIAKTIPGLKTIELEQFNGNFGISFGFGRRTTGQWSGYDGYIDYSEIKDVSVITSVKCEKKLLDKNWFLYVCGRAGP